MNKKTRDILFIVFIVVFILLSIFTSLYAAGYKLSFSQPWRWDSLLQKTGMLNIATSPRGAYIYLNDKPQKNSAFSILKKDYLTTPTKIKNILPGEYLLRLEKEGYWPLEKKISVESGQTTFLESANLFRSELPLIIVSSAEDQVLISSSRRYLYLPAQGKILNLRNETEHRLQAPTSAEGRWMKNSDKIFVAGQIIDLEKNSILDLTTTIGPTSTSWHYNEFDDRIYYSDADSINRLESDNRSVSAIIKGSRYLSYEVRGETVFTVVSEQEKLYLRSYDIRTNNKIGELELPAYGNYSLQKSSAKYLSLYDSDNHTLYLISVNDWQNSIILKDVKHWSWINDDEIIFNDAWEISIMNLASKNSSLLTRVSAELTSVLWHKNGGYFIFSTADSIQISDPRTKAVISIFRAEKLGSLVLDERSNLLYFYAKIGQQEGIYKIILQ